ncbi:MAG: discoidin domain-containing protein, partial [Verrucomicrobiota bacterium]
IEHLQYAQSALAQNGDQPTQGRTRIVLESDQEKKIWSWITAAMLLMAVTFTVYFFVFRKDAANNGIENAAAPGQSTAGGSERIFRDARRLFAHGNLREATLKFAQLKADKQTPEEIRSWILLHEALATLMENRQAEAKKMFADLATKTEPQSATPLPVLAALARQAAADEPVPAAAAAEIDKEGEEALALLVWGIKNMQENAVDSGVALLRQFRAAPLSPSVQWVSDYRRLAQPYLSDYTEYRAIADATKSVRLDEAAALISKAEEAKIRMTTPAIVKAVDEVIAPLVKSRELLESNLAYGRSAKTSSDLRPGESGAMALDGVSKSKWCSKDAPEHWLRVDLGAKRTIGRWVTKNAGYIGEDRSVNTRAFTLQSSDDSTNWRDIDAVTQNISDVTDRLVEPFEARYVRLLIFKPAQTNGEEKARLLELELYAPGIKTITYRADADVARSVMPGSSWISGDIGPIKIAGGAEWNSDSKSLTVQGSGDPWNAEDTAHLVSQPVTGNVELSARVVSEGDLPSWTKFGITLRRDRDARALHSSTFVVIKHGVMNIYRPDNGKMTHVISGENEIKAPVWLRVSRIGDHFLSAYSSDGQKWTALGEVVIPGLPPTMVAGLIVSSHEEQKLHSVTFEQIKVTALPANAKVGSELIAEPINGQAVEKRFIPIDMGAVLNANTRTGVYEEKAPKDLPLAITGAIRVGKVPFFIPDPAKGNNALALRGGMSPFSKALPKRVEIPLKKLRIQGLSFLGGVAAWGFPYGGDANANLPVVKVTVEFADGRQEELIFKNGVEYCDHVAPVVMPGAKIVEKLAEKDAFVHFFERKLSQPGEITKLVLESYDNVVVPAVLAITAEVAPVQIKP